MIPLFLPQTLSLTRGSVDVSFTIALSEENPSHAEGLTHFWGCTALKIANGTRAMSQFLPCSAPKLGQTQQ